jgi:hypothetical protein
MASTSLSSYTRTPFDLSWFTLVTLPVFSISTRKTAMSRDVFERAISACVFASGGTSRVPGQPVGLEVR